MKVLKNASQKNVIVDTDFYTPLELSEMVKERDIFTLDDERDMNVYRLDLYYVNELKVVYDKYFGYLTIAVLKNGKKIHIEL